MLVLFVPRLEGGLSLFHFVVSSWPVDCVLNRPIIAPQKVSPFMTSFFSYSFHSFPPFHSRPKVETFLSDLKGGASRNRVISRRLFGSYLWDVFSLGFFRPYVSFHQR